MSNSIDRKLKVVTFETRGGTARIELDPGEDGYRSILRGLGKIRNELRLSTHPRIACYGASRVVADDPAYKDTKELCRRLAEAGIDTVTGAGTGLMAAGSAGTAEGKAQSKARAVGLPIGGALDGNQNPHIDEPCFHENFFTRFDEFDILATLGYFCGRRVGIGTDAEAGIALQLAQFGLLKGRALVGVGDYWKRRRDLMLEFMVQDGTARTDEIEGMTIVDREMDAYDIFMEQLGRFKQKLAAA